MMPCVIVQADNDSFKCEKQDFYQDNGCAELRYIGEKRNDIWLEQRDFGDCKTI